MKTAISAMLIMVGLVMMAGSGGDCDGKRMENANTLGEMMFWAFMGLGVFITGAVIGIRNFG